MTSATGPMIGVDAWGYAAETDRRFNRIVARVLIPVAILAIVIPWIQFELLEKKEEVPPPRVIELLPDPVAKIEPKKEEEEAPAAAEEPKPAPKNEAPKQEAAPKKETPVQAQPAPPVPTARERAEKAGLMQFRDQLADLHDDNRLSAVTNQPLVNSSSPTIGSGAPSSANVVASAASGSGGIGSDRRSVTSAQSGTGLGDRRTAGVQSPIGYGSGGAAAGAGGKGNSGAAARSLQEIQLTFDRNKQSFFAIFNRAARENPGMEAGKIAVSLTIAPDGSVTRCELVSSSFNDPELEQKILQRVRLLNFGAKNVPPFDYKNYPINYLPS